MGFKSIGKNWRAGLILLVVALALAGCSRAATKAEPTKAPKAGETATPAQAMATPVPTAQPTEPDAQATSQVIVATEQAQAQPTQSPAEAATPEPVTPEPAAAAPATEQTYTVVAGDTLFSIAQRNGLAVEELAARNGIVNVNRIDVGQQLIIPVAGAEPAEPPAGEAVHVVQAGENLFRISLRYNMSFETVAAYNGIPWPYRIYPGQEIKIPPTE